MFAIWLLISMFWRCVQEVWDNLFSSRWWAGCLYRRCRSPGSVVVHIDIWRTRPLQICRHACTYWDHRLHFSPPLQNCRMELTKNRDDYGWSDLTVWMLLLRNWNVFPLAIGFIQVRTIPFHLEFPEKYLIPSETSSISIARLFLCI